MAEAEAPKTTSKPSVSFKDLNFSDGFSLKQAQKLSQQPEEAENKATVQVAVNKPFTLAELHVSVTEFARQATKKQIAVMLRTELVLLENETNIIIEIENKAQIDGFEPIKQDFLDHVRKNLSNNDIKLSLREKKADGAKKVYSPAEKFESMLIKNPSLLELKKRLDMELDY